MKEIEILVEILNPSYDEVRQALRNFRYIDQKSVIDKYYFDPLRQDLKPDKNGRIYNCFRIRVQDNKNRIAYKEDVFDGDIWQYSNEFETTIENADTMEDIVLHLGFKKLIEVNNTKDIFESDGYEIVLENVSNLGLFLEVEYKGNSKRKSIEIKEDIRSFIDQIGISTSKELNSGKPELLIRKQLKEILKKVYG